MKRIHIQISDQKWEELTELMEETGVSSQKELLSNALTLFKWAVNEKKQGRAIASMDEEAMRLKEVVLPALEAVKPEVKAASQEDDERRPAQAIGLLDHYRPEAATSIHEEKPDVEAKLSSFAFPLVSASSASLFIDTMDTYSRSFGFTRNDYLEALQALGKIRRPEELEELREDVKVRHLEDCITFITFKGGIIGDREDLDSFPDTTPPRRAFYLDHLLADTD